MQKEDYFKEDYFVKGIHFFKKGLYDKSLSCLNKNIKANPTHTPSYYYIGRIFFCKKNYKFAKEYFEICLSVDQDNDDYILHMGKTLLALKEFENAISYLKKYTKNKKDKKDQYFYGYFYLGLGYYNLNQFDVSCNYFAKCEEFLIDKSYFRLAYSASLFNYANQLFIKDDVESAKKLFYKSTTLNNEAYPSYFQLGVIYLFENDYKNSKMVFEYLTNIFPNNISIKVSLWYIYNNLNEVEKFEKLLVDLKKDGILPNLGDYEFKKILAYTLFRKKKYKEATPIFVQLYNHRKNDINSLHCLATCRYNTGEIDKTINIYNIIFKISKDNINVNNSYLLILIENCLYKEASSKALYLIQNYLANNKTRLFYYYSSILGEVKFDFAKYFTLLDKIYSNNYMFLEATGTFFLNNKNYDKATFYFYKLHTLEPNDRDILLKLVEIFILRGQTSQIINYLEKTHSIDKENETILLFYGDTLIKYGFLERAITILKNVKKESWKADYLLSDVYYKLKDKKNYFFHLKEAFGANPLYLPTQYKSINYFYKNKNYLQSLRICKLMEWTNKNFGRVFIYEALIYIKKNRFDLAIKKLEKYLYYNKSKSNPYIKFILANCYYIYGKTLDAKKLTLHLIKTNKINSPYLVVLALCYRRVYEFDKLKKVENLLETKFKDSPTYNEYKSIYISENISTYKRSDIGIRVPRK